MCFSATASFTAAAVLSTTGVVTLKKAKSTSELPLASIPLLFGIQQAIEGIVWISFGSTLLNTIAAYGFLFFAYVLWPILVPIATLLVETHPLRRRILQAFMAQLAMWARSTRISKQLWLLLLATGSTQ